MSPPFCIVNTITPSAYFTLLEPVAATAETWAANSIWLFLNHIIRTQKNHFPTLVPAWTMLSCDNFAKPTSFSHVQPPLLR
jgi:hypothetical protein